SYYDLLASEARLASFIAIAKGDVPQEHWFRLGRQLTPVDGGRALISWTATMFEYLMPLLVMRDYERTLLDETYHAIVARQIEYGSERRIPWGFSEAAYTALDNLLHQDVMQRRFQAEPLVQATELLLQERIPRGVPAAHPRAEEVLSGRVVRTLTGLAPRVYDSPDLPTPRTQLLSNGTYSVMLTTAGAGYSACAGLAVTRWREDVTRDHYGSFIYLRDVRRGTVWSAGHQPIGRQPETYEVAFSEDKVDFWRSDLGVGTHMEIIVTPEDNAELRRLSLTNQSTRVREIEVTSYAEVVLAPAATDAAHPAFSNLFIETEFVAAENALIARRRPRASTDEPVYGVHIVVTEGERIGALQYETDRSRFLGRGHTPAQPVVVFEDRPLSNTVGAVLDPIFSLRQRVRIQPGETVRLTFTTAVARTREEAQA